MCSRLMYTSCQLSKTGPVRKRSNNVLCSISKVPPPVPPQTEHRVQERSYKQNTLAKYRQQGLTGPCCPSLVHTQHHIKIYQNYGFSWTVCVLLSVDLLRSIGCLGGLCISLLGSYRTYKSNTSNTDLICIAFFAIMV